MSLTLLSADCRCLISGYLLGLLAIKDKSLVVGMDVCGLLVY